MIYKIRKKGSPIFEKKTLEVKTVTKDILSLIRNMWETLKANNFIGLAANQCGSRYKIIIIDYLGYKGVMINPKIIDRTGFFWSVEQCGSIPGIPYLVYRHVSIKVSYSSPENVSKKIVEDFKGSLSGIVQHEIDHLDKIFISDRGTQLYESRQISRP